MNKLFDLEAKKHGDSLFHYAAYRMDFDADRIILDCHWHSEVEFLMITDGGGIFHLGDDFYEVRRGQALIIHSGCLHSGRTLPGRNCSFEASVFSPDLIRSAGKDLIQQKQIDPVLKGLKYMNPLITGENPEEEVLLRKIKELYSGFTEKEEHRELQVKIRLLQIFLCLNRVLRRRLPVQELPESGSSRENAVKEVLGYIQSNYQRRISLKELAGVSGFSSGHFTRVFTETVHMTPVEYLNFFRIGRSVELMKNRNLSLASIAEECGFSSVNYYIRSFRRIKGATPAAFRKSEQLGDLT
ncbi:MAG: AraC family transcriptional regulator [Spirochaetales bacterium]|nr:AraC family transcriptional regulator [Spirochaetales bacterium]